MVFSSTEAFEDFVFEGTQFLAEASGTAWNAKGAAGDPLDPSQVRVISEVGGLYGGAVIGGFGVSVDRSMMRKAYGDAVTPRTILDDRGVVTPAGAATLWKSLGR
jgi:lipid-binding SYLF domain-containing protein